jgi:hypothetical protein
MCFYHCAINCFTRNGGNAIPKHACPEAKVDLLDLPCSGPISYSGEILTTGKSHGKKPDRFSLNDYTDVKKVPRFIYVTWNIRGLGEKEEEEELDKILNENNIKISVVTERKRKLQGTKETELYTECGPSESDSDSGMWPHCI